MKKILRTAVLTLCLLFLAGMGHTVTAAEEDGQAAASDTSDIPTVTFTNKENTTPDLNVVKYVESLDPAYPAPADAQFTFVIKVDGELLRKKEYELYKADAPGVAPERYETDRNGSFKLKAGERARFVYLGAGKHYEVYEEALPDHFVQIDPAAGTSVTGTIPPAGALAAFTNQYQPPVEPPGPGPDPETTKLLVSKRIAFPAGYTPPESPDFRFKVTIDGNPYADEPYEVVSLATGLPIRNGVTGGFDTQEDTTAALEPGEFTLKAGEQAVFTEIPVDVDYKVEELLADGWWSVNDVTSQEGATKAPAVTVDFTNANTSFIVTKQLEDNSKPEKKFTFTLMKGDNSHWARAKYYLYSTKGEKLSEVQYTDENGQFQLKPGQAAVFFGIEPGTLYHVSEQKDPEYSQLTPNDPAGYRDKVVQTNVEVLPFVNRKDELKGVLTVTKQVVAEDGVSPEDQPDFTFCISKGEKTAGTTGAEEPGSGEDAGMTYKPMTDIPYEISTGTTTQTRKTKEDGTFTLKAGETARFYTLSMGNYQVEELTEELSKEYTPPKDNPQQAELVMQEEAGVSFVFENRFKVLPLSLKLVKTGWGSDELLPNAVFRLYQAYENNEPIEEILPEDHLEGTPFEGYITDKNGTVTIEGLKAGTYYLKEVKAPEGYQLLANPLEIVITRRGDKLEATVNSIKPDQDGNGQVTIEGDTVTVTIKNSKNFTLPATGGEGIAFLLAAAAGIVLVLAVLWKKGKVKIKK